MDHSGIVDILESAGLEMMTNLTPIIPTPTQQMGTNNQMRMVAGLQHDDSDVVSVLFVCNQHRTSREHEPGERLSTSRMGTSVWTLSCMYSTSAGQLVPLKGYLPVSSERATVAEGFHAFCTSVWSLSRMNTDMYGESGSLDEFFSTFVTFVWSVQSQQASSNGNRTLTPSVFVLDKEAG